MSKFGDLFQSHARESLLCQHGTEAISYTNGKLAAQTISAIFLGEELLVESDESGEKNVFESTLGISLSSTDGIENPLPRDKVEINGSQYIVVEIQDLNTETGFAWLRIKRATTREISREGLRQL